MNIIFIFSSHAFIPLFFLLFFFFIVHFDAMRSWNKLHVNNHCLLLRLLNLALSRLYWISVKYYSTISPTNTSMFVTNYFYFKRNRDQFLPLCSCKWYFVLFYVMLCYGMYKNKNNVHSQTYYVQPVQVLGKCICIWLYV